MAKNFFIRAKNCNGQTFLELHGDFDGISAFDLLIFLKEHCFYSERITIDTDRLKRVFCFGVQVWKEQLYMVDALVEKITFCGSKACYLACEGEKKVEEDSKGQDFAFLGLTC